MKTETEEIFLYFNLPGTYINEIYRCYSNTPKGLETKGAKGGAY